MPVRIYLTGRVRIEAGERLIDEGELPGRQGRLLLVVLVLQRSRPTPRDELADVLWGDALPAAWDKGLSALVSKVRGNLAAAGLPPDAVTHGFGGYQLRLRSDIWIDVEAAFDAVHRAELLLAEGDTSAAYGWTFAAYHILGRPFLPGEDGPWVTRHRHALVDLRLRALDCAVACNAAAGDIDDAVRAGEQALALDPLREGTYQLLMRSLADAGRRAEALRVWERCRGTLAEQLGVAPSTQTEAVYLEILRR